MNTSCKANTELSHCLTNNLDLLKIGNTSLIKGFLPLLPAKEVTPRRRARKLSVSSSGTKNHVETSREDKGEVLTYKDAGVDIDAGSELVRRIAKMAPGIGGFGGLFPLGMALGFSCYCILYTIAAWIFVHSSWTR